MLKSYLSAIGLLKFNSYTHLFVYISSRKLLAIKPSNISHLPFYDFSWNSVERRVGPTHFILHVNTSLDNTPWQRGAALVLPADPVRATCPNWERTDPHGKAGLGCAPGKLSA